MLNKIEMTALPRRDVLRLAGAGAAGLLAAAVVPDLAAADARSTAAEIKKIITGRTPQQGRITLELPQIAENGNAVPIAFEVESPMSEADHVKAVYIFADANPTPLVAKVRFSPASGRARVATRMRMRESLKVIVLAELSDGSVQTAKAEVTVTNGGCGSS